VHILILTFLLCFHHLLLGIVHYVHVEVRSTLVSLLKLGILRDWLRTVAGGPCSYLRVVG